MTSDLVFELSDQEREYRKHVSSALEGDEGSLKMLRELFQESWRPDFNEGRFMETLRVIKRVLDYYETGMGPEPSDDELDLYEFETDLILRINEGQSAQNDGLFGRVQIEPGTMCYGLRGSDDDD